VRVCCCEFAAHAHETEILQERLTALSVELERLRLSAAFTPPFHSVPRMQAGAGAESSSSAFGSWASAAGRMADKPWVRKDDADTWADGGLDAKHDEAAAAAASRAHAASTARRHAELQPCGDGADGGWGVVDAADEPRPHAPAPSPLPPSSGAVSLQRALPPAAANAGGGGNGGSLSLLAIKQVRLARPKRAIASGPPLLWLPCCSVYCRGAPLRTSTMLAQLSLPSRAGRVLRYLACSRPTHTSLTRATDEACAMGCANPSFALGK
jgi:hypothetical protein